MDKSKYQKNQIYRVVAWNKYKEHDDFFENEKDAVEVYNNLVEKMFDIVHDNAESEVATLLSDEDSEKSEYARKQKGDFEETFKNHETFDVTKKAEIILEWSDAFPYPFSVNWEPVAIYKKKVSPFKRKVHPDGKIDK
jgi:hypothetical protein